MTNKIVKVGASAAVAAVLASGVAAYYFTQTPQGKNTAKKIKKVAANLGKELAHKVATAKKVSKQHYEEAIEELVDQYTKKKKIAATTADHLKKDLKRNWKEVQAELKQVNKK